MGEFTEREGSKNERKTLKELDEEEVFERFERDCEQLLAMFPEQCAQRFLEMDEY